MFDLVVISVITLGTFAFSYFVHGHEKSKINIFDPTQEISYRFHSTANDNEGTLRIDQIGNRLDIYKPSVYNLNLAYDEKLTDPVFRILCQDCRNRNRDMIVYPCDHFICAACLRSDVYKAIKKEEFKLVCSDAYCKETYVITHLINNCNTLEFKKPLTIDMFLWQDPFYIHSVDGICQLCGGNRLVKRITACKDLLCTNCIRKTFEDQADSLDPLCPICHKLLRNKPENAMYKNITVIFQNVFRFNYTD